MSNELKAGKANNGLRLVRKPVVAATEVPVLREGSTGRVVGMLPRVWAVAEGGGTAYPVADENGVMDRPAAGAEAAPRAELAFYRKYTEALLRRYLRLSMQTGRVPSLMGREIFRGQVTHYRSTTLEDVVIFCHDVERRLARLRPMDRELIKRIVLQNYTLWETAGMLGISLRNSIRLYRKALDSLTEMLLEDRLLEPQKCCQ